MQNCRLQFLNCTPKQLIDIFRIFPIGKNEDANIQIQNESVDDPLMVFVNQCNAENDGGDAKLPNEPDWNTTEADLKEIIALTPQF